MDHHTLRNFVRMICGWRQRPLGRNETVVWSFGGFLKIADTTHMMQFPAFPPHAEEVTLDVVRGNSTLLLERWWIRTEEHPSSQQHSLPGGGAGGSVSPSTAAFDAQLDILGSNPTSSLAPLKVVVRTVYAFLAATDAGLRASSTAAAVAVSGNIQGDAPMHVKLSEHSQPPRPISSHRALERPFCFDWSIDCGPDAGLVHVSVRRMFSAPQPHQLQQRLFGSPTKVAVPDDEQPPARDTTAATTTTTTTTTTSDSSLATGGGHHSRASSLPVSSLPGSAAPSGPLAAPPRHGDPTPTLRGCSPEEPPTAMEALDMPAAVLDSVKSPLTSPTLGPTKPKPKLPPAHLTPIIGPQLSLTASSLASAAAASAAAADHNNGESASGMSSRMHTGDSAFEAARAQGASSAPPPSQMFARSFSEESFHVGADVAVKITNESFGCAISANTVMHPSTLDWGACSSAGIAMVQPRAPDQTVAPPATAADVFRGSVGAKSCFEDSSTAAASAASLPENAEDAVLDLLTSLEQLEYVQLYADSRAAARAAASSSSSPRSRASASEVVEGAINDLNACEDRLLADEARRRTPTGSILLT